MFYVKNINVTLLLFTLCIPISFAFETCTPHPPCFCEYDDGKVMDLTPLSTGDFLEGTKGNLTYYFHPCANKRLKLPDVNSTKDCEKDNGISLCLFNRTSNSYINVGKSEDALIVSSVTDNGLYDMLFPNQASNKTTFITLVCTTIQESILHVELNPKHHNLILFSHYACAQQVIHGLSTGSVLVILLLVFTTIYLLGGATILHFLRGARGKEMIPNIDFWRDLPLLVRDGVIFMQNGCKPPQQQGETYDRI